jgi:periplasmic copper chaperone A
MKQLLVLGAILGALTLAACGAAQTHGLHVENGWASPTPGGVNLSAGYLTIVNDSDTADRLTAASSPRAERVDLHEMSMDGPVMRMRMTQAIAIPAHGRVSLAPGAAHLMFTAVGSPFAEGQRIPVELRFEHAGVVAVELPVSRAEPQHQH